MTAPNLIAIVGAGSALSLAGFALMGGAAGVALAYYFPQIHLSIWLLIIGGVMLVLGLALVERGGAKTVQKVENELSMPKVVSNFPWTFIALGAGATMFAVWLLGRRPFSIVDTLSHRRRTTAKQQGRDEHDEEEEEEHLRDLSRGARHSKKSESARYQGDNQKHDRIVQHDLSLLRLPSLIDGLTPHEIVQQLACRRG